MLCHEILSEHFAPVYLRYDFIHTSYGNIKWWHTGIESLEAIAAGKRRKYYAMRMTPYLSHFRAYTLK
jgi:hypothetical protein